MACLLFVNGNELAAPMNEEEKRRKDKLRSQPTQLQFNAGLTAPAALNGIVLLVSFGLPRHCEWLGAPFR